MHKSIRTLSLFAALAFSAPAWADVPPPNSEGCTGKAAGDACQKDDMSAGSCESQTCTKLDYSMGSPPTSVEYACILCSGPAPSSSSSSTSSSGGGESEEAGCSVRGGGMAGAAGAWILGAAVLMFARRKRSRKTNSSS